MDLSIRELLSPRAERSSIQNANLKKLDRHVSNGLEVERIAIHVRGRKPLVARRFNLIRTVLRSDLVERRTTGNWQSKHFAVLWMRVFR
jgi:hypothetical protein